MGDSEDEFRPLPAGGRRRRHLRAADAASDAPGLRGGAEAAAAAIAGLPGPGEAEADGAASEGLVEGAGGPSAASAAARRPTTLPRADAEPPAADPSPAAAPPPPPPGRICPRNRSALDGAVREHHGLRRPDGVERRLVGPDAPAGGPAVPECPVCGKRFGTAKSRGGHLKRCAARMEVPPAVLLQAVRQQEAEAAGARGPGLPPAPSGLKRKGASSAEPAAKKPKKAAAQADGADEDLQLAVAMSRSLLEEEKAAAQWRARGKQDGTWRGRRALRAGKSSRAKPAHSPPPLLLQDPERARRETEQRVALLLSEAEEFPSTPPLPASHLALPQGLQGRSLWEFSSLAGLCAAAPASFHAGGLVLPLQMPLQGPGPGSPPETEPVQPSQGGDCGGLQGSVGEPRAKPPCSQKDTEALQYLMELAGEGLTLTQWDLEVQQLQGAGQEPVAEDALQSRSIQFPEKKKKPSPRSSHRAFPLGSLAAAFRGMVNNPHLSDVQFQVDSGELLYGHLFVLYARCPQLMEVADSQGFTVAEDGAAKTCRVLLNDVPEEAVRVFLNYLYTADHAVPRHVLSDVAALATRFGVEELAALCGDQPGLGVSGREEEEEEGGAAAAEDDNRAETFEELLKSMWLDEGGDALLKCAHRDNVSSSRDHMSEPELEEIYAFAATQRRAAPEEEGGSRRRQPKEGGPQACSSKGLEEPAAAVATGECQEVRGPEAPGDVHGEEALGRLPLEAQQEAKERRPPGASARGSSPIEALLRRAEASGEDSSPELPRAWEESPKSPPAREPSVDPACQDTIPGKPPSPLQRQPKDLRSALELLPRDHQVPVLPVEDSPLGLSAAGAPSHAGSLLLSVSPLPRMGWRFFPSQDGQQEHVGRRKSPERPTCSPRPLQANSEAALIMVLDSDEELEPGQRTDPGLSGCSLSPEEDGCGSQGPSLHPHQGTVDPLLAMPLCGEPGSPRCKSPQHWGLSSGEEDCSSSEGRTLLAPDTPPLSWPGAKCSRTPGPREQWARASQAALRCPLRSFPERPSLQSLGPACDRPLPRLSAACLPGSGPSPPGADVVVVVVDDSEEEQEAAPPFPGGTSAPGEGLPAWEEAAGISLPFAGPGSPPETGPRSEGGGEEGSPLSAGSAVASRAAAPRFGKASSSERQWAGGTGEEDSDDSSEAPPLPLTQTLPASVPLEETPGLACRAQDVSWTSPLSPMPSYSTMETPKLKKELSRFGVRALPKRKMVLKLKEIFQYTHPKVGAGCQARPRPSRLPPPHSPAKTALRTVQPTLASSTPQKQRPGLCWRTDPSGGGDQGHGQLAEPCRSQAGSGQPRGTAVPAARFPVGGSPGGPSLTASQESTGSEASVTSQSSSSPDFEGSTLAAEEEEEEEEEVVVPASQAAASEAQKLAALQRYLHSKPALHRQILLFQPIELAVLQAELKQNGIRIALRKLLDFLDALCINFTAAKARQEKPQRRRRTKQKGRQRRC